jgi:hypothetical protein
LSVLYSSIKNQVSTHLKITTVSVRCPQICVSLLGAMSDEVAKAQQAGGEEDTIFGKIARGEIPCEFLYQDEQVCIFNFHNSHT